MELLEKLKARCACVQGMTDEQFAVTWDDFVMFLSNITCWDIHGGTILPECRQHAVKLTRPFCSYSCVEVQPYWKNINLNTVAVEVRQYTSEGMNVIPVDKRFFNYDDIADRFYVKLKDVLIDDRCDPCFDCTNNVLVFKYEAGYELDTPEWLNIICHYFTSFVAIANDCVSVNDCSAMSQIAVGARLTKKTVDTIKYEWEVDKASKEVFFNRLMQSFYFDVLGRYALCGREFKHREQITIGKVND